MSRDEILKNLPLVKSIQPGLNFKIRGVEIGNGKPVIIGGPCAVESLEQIIETAESIKQNGGHGLRGGVFKPRSSPYSFQGLGKEGLDYLAEAREKTGLFTVVEITAISQINITADYADVFQIGARNMQNFELLKAIGRMKKPVLLKRGLSATIQELLQAAEYIMNENNPYVILCERGIRTFETMTRNTLDINAIALLKQLTNLPVFADPSHGTGHRDLVVPIAKAALSAGADGLIIEVHPEPEQALSDGIQSLNFKAFADLMKQIPVSKSIKNTDFHVSPDIVHFNELSSTGKYKYIPISHQFVTDTETPVTAFLKLTETRQRFLLESVERGEQLGRFSFIGWEPLFTIKSMGSEVEIGDDQGQKTTLIGDPLLEMENILKKMQVAFTPELGKFFGGAVGFIGYDYVRLIENLPEENQKAATIPDVSFMIPKYMAQFDHVLHKITLIGLAEVNEVNSEISAESYFKMQNQLCEIRQKLDRQLNLEPLPDNCTNKQFQIQREYSLSKQGYSDIVNKAREYIFAGDAFQVVLSQQISQSFKGDPFQFYRLLRTINPSPYLFYLDYGDMQLAGSSPEVMVRRDGQEVTLKPIAGTRPRGKSAVEDQKLRTELLQDEKELAEHVMLVDLGRNDLGRVCKTGTVTVKDLMNVEYYSHVMHIVSTIAGELADPLSSVDLFRAVFPAGTLSGAPKIRAMEIIEELEPSRRGFYGGAVGYFGFNHNLDTCITIRSVLFNNNRATLQVGAGIVADSIPEKEYEETMNKAGALLMALDRVVS